MALIDPLGITAGRVHPCHVHLIPVVVEFYNVPRMSRACNGDAVKTCRVAEILGSKSITVAHTRTVNESGCYILIAVSAVAVVTRCICYLLTKFCIDIFLL